MAAVIDSEACSECGVCADECPADAIRHPEVPATQQRVRSRDMERTP